MKKIEGRVGIVLAGSSPTEEEQEIIDSARFLKRVFANGKFMVCNSGERLVCKHLLNLSGREDVDAFYKDILLDVSDYRKPAKAEPKKAPAVVVEKPKKLKKADKE